MILNVMSMNYQGNESPHISLDRRDEDQRIRLNNREANVNPLDVLCGRGKSSFTHVGNRRFRDAITSAIDEYNSSESRLAKSRVVQRIVEDIKGSGGRFLKKERSTGRWVELDSKSCRDKVGHAIRDAANLIEARKNKEQRKKETFAKIEGKGKGKSATSSSSQWEDSKMDDREGSKQPASSRSSSRYEDDDIYFGSLSESKFDDDDFPEVAPVDVPAPEEDPFVRHINEVLGPIPEQETSDPLRDFLDNLGSLGRGGR